MFLSRRYRPNKWPFFAIIAFEVPLTVALLALFGIAAPNLYRTKLWQDGADNGFNSSPSTGLYAAANYRPYTTPKVWSQFITNYNVVISVLSMFIMLVKSIMYMLHCFPPILSVLVHGILIALYAVSIDYQASSDTSDPQHPQNGAPWYITKSCSVAHKKSLVGYCTQAKAAFAATCGMLGLFVLYFGFAAWSCIPSKVQRAEYEERHRAREEKYARFEGATELNDAEDQQRYAVPQTPGFQTGMNPVTPRTMAFNTLGGGVGGGGGGGGGGSRDLPLRNHFSSPNAPTSPKYGTRSPPLSRHAASPEPEQAEPEAEEITATPKLYFPPPPKISSKK